MTFGILVTTNEIGYELARRLEGERAPYEEMLSSSVNSRQVAEILLDILSFLSNPLSKQHLSDLYGRLREFGVAALQNNHAGIIERWYRKHNTEVALYASMLPSGIDPLEEIDDSIRSTIESFSGLMRRWMRAVVLPVDQLVLTIAGDLFTEARMATSQRIAATMRTWVDVNPTWRLPELVRELDQGIKSRLLRLEDETTVFEPTPGVITLTTMHRAKGLEWDFVFLVDTDVERFHYHAEEAFKGEYAFLGGNPEAEVKAAIQAIVGDSQYSGMNPTEAARIESIAEDCRLLYVGITRARRYLALSWGQQVYRYGKTNPVEPAIVFNRLMAFVKNKSTSSNTS
jgi:DNA helicase-2/ATP-dependent DNA helicase PcrA